MKPATIVGLILIVVNSPAHAESAADVIKGFGLAGVWSANCAKISESFYDAAMRVSYAVPFFGLPTMEKIITSQQGKRIDHSKFEITSAERVTDDKIKLVWKALSIETTLNGEQKQADLQNTGYQVVIRIGTKIRFLEERSGNNVLIKDGLSYVAQPTGNGIEYRSSGQETGVLEKCLN